MNNGRQHEITMIYLVGLNHALQIGAYSGSTAEHPDLVDAKVMERVKGMLEHWIDTFNINVLAEELSIQAIERRGVKLDETPGAVVCTSKLVRHEFVDVDSSERADISEKLSGRANVEAIREAIWSDRLSRFYGQNVLMLCGAVHVTTLALTLLNYRDIDQMSVTILHREWIPFGCRERFVVSGGAPS